MNSTSMRNQGRPLDLARGLSAAGKQVFTVSDARSFLSKDEAVWLALTRLQKAGWVKRLKRGVYMIVPLEAGVEKEWSEDAFVIACALAKPAAVAYWSAMRHWNWTSQIPSTIFVQTTQRKFSYTKTIQGVKYRFVPVIQRKFFGLRQERIGGKQFSVTDREKTILDMLDRPDLCGGMPEVLGAIQTALSEIEWDRLDEYVKKFPNRTALKRLGFLVQELGLHIPNRENRLELWREAISRGVALLDPGVRPRGPIRTAWGIRVNIPVRVSVAA